MSFHTASGTLLSKTQLESKATSDTVSTTYYTFTEPIYEAYNLPGTKAFEGNLRLKYRTGQVVTSDEIDALFAGATIASVTPATGAAAGGTNITIVGTNLSGASGVKVGGASATNFVVVNDTTITCTTPAGTTGAADVVVADDSGNATKTGGFTYA